MFKRERKGKREHFPRAFPLGEPASPEKLAVLLPAQALVRTPPPHHLHGLQSLLPRDPQAGAPRSTWRLHTSLPGTSCPSHPSFSPETENPKAPCPSVPRARGRGRGDTGTPVASERSAARDDTGTTQGRVSGGHPGSAGHRYSLRPDGAICSFPFPLWLQPSSLAPVPASPYLPLLPKRSGAGREKPPARTLRPVKRTKDPGTPGPGSAGSRAEGPPGIESFTCREPSPGT